MLGLRMHRATVLAPAEADGAVDAETVALESLGHRLRMRREAMQLDVQAVCEKLHVRCAVIEALEADDYARAGTPMVYLRGYARNYVRLLNPEGPSLQAWLDEVGQIGMDAAVPVKRRGAGALGRAGVASIRPWFNPRWLPWVAILVAVLLAIFLLQPSTQPSSTSSVVAPDVPKAAPESSDVSAPAAPAADATAAEVKPAEAVATQSPQSETSTQAPPRGTLRLEFTDRSWTQVEDGLGRVLEKRTVEAGSTNRYEGVLPFRVTLGNAVYVRVYFNDQEYDHLNDITDNNIARFQLGAPEAR